MCEATRYESFEEIKVAAATRVKDQLEQAQAAKSADEPDEDDDVATLTATIAMFT